MLGSRGPRESASYGADTGEPTASRLEERWFEALIAHAQTLFDAGHPVALIGDFNVVPTDEDIYNPKYVSEYRHPNARIHDLWVHDGIAYSAQGGAGTVVVDVGNGKYGGTIEKPKLITVYAVNSGHEIFPYFQNSTGKVYLFIGDEEMNRTGRVWEGTNYFGEMTKSGGVAQTSGGFTHIVDFTDPTSVTTPFVSASARLTWSAIASTGTATNVITASGSSPLASIALICSARSTVAGLASSPHTHHPRARNPVAIEPPISPSPMTFATRSSVFVTWWHSAGASERAPASEWPHAACVAGERH